MSEVTVSTTGTDAGLVRAIGVRGLASNVVNNVVGSGIFVLPAVVAATLGASAIIAYIICAFAIGLIGLSFAAVGSRVSKSGGTYAYAEEAFGPFVGFLTGATFWLSQMVSAAAIATVLAGSVAALVPSLSSPIPRATLLILVYVLMAGVNIRGVKAGVRVMETLTIVKVVPLVLIVVAGAFFIRPVNLRWTSMPTFGAISTACLLLVFTFTGVEGAVTTSGEVSNPSRTVPRAIILGLAGVSLLYVLVQLAAQGVLGPELALDQAAPLASVADRMFGATGRTIIALAMIVSALGYISGDMLATPRLLFAFGRDGFLPARVGSVNQRYRTPVVAIVLYGALTCGFALTGTFRSLVILATVTTLFVYAVTCLAAIELKRRNVVADGPPFQLAGGPVIPLLACVVIAWMLTGAERREFISVGATLVVAAILYGIRAIFGTRPISVSES